MKNNKSKKIIINGREISRRAFRPNIFCIAQNIAYEEARKAVRAALDSGNVPPALGLFRDECRNPHWPYFRKGKKLVDDLCKIINKFFDKYRHKEEIPQSIYNYAVALCHEHAKKHIEEIVKNSEK